MLCLRRWTLGNSCQRCADECPQNAIHFEEAAPSIDAKCVACGRCAAVCPTGALSLSPETVALTSKAHDATKATRVECERAPADVRQWHGVVTVKCLGALDLGALLELCVHAGSMPVELVDRGVCLDCPAGGAIDAPGGEARARLAALFAEMGGADRSPQVVRIVGSARDDSIDRLRARRGFLRRLGQSSTSAATRLPRVDAADKRLRMLNLLSTLASTLDRQLPASALPQASISQACRNHRVCAAACPTGALLGYESNGARGVRFYPQRCIECEICVRLCPEHALTFSATSPPTDTDTDAQRALTAHRTRTCSDCDNAFADFDGEDKCPLCRKNDALFANDFLAAHLGSQLPLKPSNEETRS